MEALLEEYYKTDPVLERFHDRKIFLDEASYQLNGVTQSGKTKLIKSYLSTLKKNTYIYIDCEDVRIDFDVMNTLLPRFCIENKITTLAFDNYNSNAKIFNIKQLIIASQKHYELDFLETIQVYPLDFEEFLAYEHKFDSSALNHYLKLGGLAVMHKVASDERNLFLQRVLKHSLEPIEFDIFALCARLVTQKLSAYAIYERLKNTQKISKDKLYSSFESLLSKHYLHQLQKVDHPKAVKKIYLCDIAFKAALTTEKHFGRLFENMIFLELLKSNQECYYDDGIDFYLPQSDEVILCMPFADERSLFKKVEELEAFIFSYQIKRITAITMSKEGKISHPISKIEMLPFDIWALGD